MSRWKKTSHREKGVNVFLQRGRKKRSYLEGEKLLAIRKDIKGR